ncbi:MAG: CHAT domain-containing protein, partial [Moorea sp. SIO3C2]|nr:CHAT domain-containing protein [Moorena sp. SIO3C2]
EINAPDIAYQWQWQIGRILKAQAQQATTTSNSDTKAVTELIDHAIAYYTQASNTLTNLRNNLVALNPDIQFSFREQVEPVYRELVDLLLRSPQPSNDNLKQAREVIEKLQLAEIDKLFRDACTNPKKVKIDNIDPTAALIYTIILKDRLAVIIRLPKQDDLLYISHDNLSEYKVDQAVKNFKESIQNTSGKSKDIKEKLPPIYNWIIKPFEEELETTGDRNQSSIKTLVFILDGSLRNLPVTALYDREKDKYLIERYAVAVTPGLELIDPKPFPRQQLRVLLAGAKEAPSFNKEGFGTIKNVESELSKIGEKVNYSQKLENQDFTQENLQNKLKAAPFNVVHIATHGQFSSNPEDTFILDWNGRITVKDLDQLLRVSDPNGTTPIELLVLSGCETADGDKRAALGLAGIAIRGGARSTLATLWQVNDASTAEFMKELYQQLKDNLQLTKAEALRKTQLEFIMGRKNKFLETRYDLPYYWAPFILIGNWL